MWLGFLEKALCEFHSRSYRKRLLLKAMEALAHQLMKLSFAANNRIMAEKVLRLVLGDQLNEKHHWFDQVNDNVSYVMMEIKAESEYVTHHIQKIVGIFAAMRQFAQLLKTNGHHVRYFKINDKDNLQSFADNLQSVLQKGTYTRFEYLEPDEYRLDQLLKQYCDKLEITTQMLGTEHFYTDRSELKNMFEGKNSLLMETFYRNMRKKHHILMDDGKPISGKWNYDHENRKKLPANHVAKAPMLFGHDVEGLLQEIESAKLSHIGQIEPTNFLWPTSRAEALELYQYFLDHMLQFFGAYQDSMAQEYWSVYHSRISFAMNIKLVSPTEIVSKAEEHWLANQKKISIAQVEGFIRQILGWREYMRGVYWAHMPAFADLNYFQNKDSLPKWYWTGSTDMNCLHKAIDQSLKYSYAHHIQRLMVTGNFALLAGVDPDEVDKWYLGIYIDAFEWVEITNTRGMSQFADGGIVGTKPYVSSGSYIQKMGDYCSNCKYDYKKKVGEGSCPFNSLYWNFIDQHRDRLSSNRRMTMMYSVWDKYSAEDKAEVLEQAAKYLEDIDNL